MSTLVCLAAFAAGYLLNMVTITVLYHRGLAHGAVALSPGTRRWVARWGIWITGLDPKGWVCMHRRHHAYSDGPEDPHSPTNQGLWGVLLGQLLSYRRTLSGLLRGDPRYTRYVRDLDFEISWLNRRGAWPLPYALQIAMGALIAAALGDPLAGAAWVAGLMSHPLQGWAVNALGHAVGRRNFETPDNSRNNLLVGLLAFGEGYQNNHHAHPRSARFSYRRVELDLGFASARLLDALGLVTIDRERLMSTARERRAAR